MNAILWYVKYAHAFCFAIISRYVGVYMIEVHCSVPGKREFVVIHGFRSNPRFLIAQARPETGGWGEQRNISLDQGVTTRCMKPGTWTGWISEYDSNEDSDDSDDGSDYDPQGQDEDGDDEDDDEDDDEEGDEDEATVDYIMDERWMNKGGCRQFLISWLGYPQQFDSWVNEGDLIKVRQRCPAIDDWETAKSKQAKKVVVMTGQVASDVTHFCLQVRICKLLLLILLGCCCCCCCCCCLYLLCC